MSALRYDGVNPELLGIRRVCSDDSVRRAVARLEAGQVERWLCRHLEYVWRPLLQQDWILDVDTTVKPLYGRHEGAQMGYNPHKRGRPAQVIHACEMGTTRLVLEAEVAADRQHHIQRVWAASPSGSRLTVRPVCGHRNRRTRTPAGVLRTQVPCGASRQPPRRW